MRGIYHSHSRRKDKPDLVYHGANLLGKNSVFTVSLAQQKVLSDSTIELQFQRDDGESVVFVPGQFFRFVFTDVDGEFERSYSLCNLAPDTTGILMLVISKVDGGRATRLLFNTECGLKASVTGPFGRLVLPEKLPKRLFLVATSVGIAPYLPMLGPLSGPLCRDEIEVFLLLGVRDPSEFIYATVLVDFQHRYPRFHLRLCYSRRLPDSPRSFEGAGYVQDYLPAVVPSQDLVMLCGNPMMVDVCFDKLKQAGLPSRQVIREKYVFAKQAAVKPPSALSAEQKRLIEEKMQKYRS